MSNKKTDTGENNFGTILKKARHDRDFTQNELGELLKISGDYISRIEKGERAPSNLIKTVIDEWIRTGKAPSDTSPATPAQPTEKFNMAEALGQTRIVLESETVYRPALLSNIRAFHKAVIMEGEMQEFREESLKRDQAMTDRLERMEQILVELTGKAHEKKAKTANGNGS